MGQFGKGSWTVNLEKMTNPSNLLTPFLLSIPLLVALASPAPPYDTDNSEMLEEKIGEKEEMLEQGKIVSLTPDTIENLPTATLTPTDISTAEDSSSTSFLEVVGYLAAIPLLAISPFLLLGLAIFILPLLAGGSLILILMVLGGSIAIMVPLIFGMPVLALPLLLLAALDGELTILPEELPEGSGLSEDETMQINISDLISALTTASPEKDFDWNATNVTSSSATNKVDNSVNFNDDNDNVNSIPHSAVPRLLSW